MSNPFESSISIVQLYHAIQRHKVVGFLTFLLVFSLPVAAWILLPRAYGSEGQVVVRLGRANLGMNTAPDGARELSIQDTRETEIRSVVELVKSSVVLGKVVDTIGADSILENTIRIPLAIPSWKPDGEFSDEEYDRLRKRERAIERLVGQLDVASEKKAALISIYCTGATPHLAQRIVTEIIVELQKAHVEIHSAGRSRSHFDRELERVKSELEQKQTTLQEFRSSNGFLTVEDARTTLNAVVSRLLTEMVEIRVDLEQSLALARELESQRQGVEVELDLPRAGVERRSTEGAQSQLYARIGEKARLLATYNSTHPKVMEINKEIARLESEVASLPADRVESDKIRNPVYQQLQIELIQERSRARSLASRLDKVNVEFENSRKELASLNRLEVESARHKREIDIARQEFDIYNKKRAEVKVVDQLDKEAISDIAVHQPASLMLKKHSPRGSILLPLGFVLASICGFLVTLFADRKNLIGPTTPEEIEEALDIPVLVTIPRVHSSRVLSNHGNAT